MAWTNTGGGDHGGKSWTPANGLEIAGEHTNIGTFTVQAGRTIYIKAYNGSSYGNASITASKIRVYGQINGDYRGYRGGDGGRGGHGAVYSQNSFNTQDSVAGSKGEADNSARQASGGSAVSGVNYGSADPDWLNHRNWKGSTGNNGNNGGYYHSSGGNGDTSTNETLYMGGGGGGASGGTGGGGYGASFNVTGGGGGGGGAGSEGGAYIKLIGYQEVTISDKIQMRGGNNIAGNGDSATLPSSRWDKTTRGNGGSATASGTSSGGDYSNGILADGSTPDSGIRGGSGGAGGDGAGGGILLKCYKSNGWNLTGAKLRVHSRGSGGDGTVKIFYSDTGSDPSGDATINSGRTYTADFDAGADPPTALVASKSSTADTIELTWTDNADGDCTWYVDRRVNEGVWVALAEAQAAGTTTYTDSTATSDAYYYYRVRGYHTTYAFYTEYTYSNSVDMAGDTKMIGQAGKHIWGLDANYSGGIWETLQNYAEGTITTAVNGSVATVTGDSTLFNVYNNVEVGDVLFTPTVSGSTGTINYDAPFPVTVVSDATTLVVSGSVPTLATATNYTIAKTLTIGDPIDYLTYGYNLFMAKTGNAPLRYDGTNTKPVGCTPPSTACSGTGDTGGSLDAGAVYKYKITFIYGTYGESNGSPEFELDLDDGDTEANLTSIPTGGQFVTARKIYRTEGGGSTFYYVNQIADNTTTIYTDQASDATISATGIECPTTYDVPENFACIAEKYTRLFGGGNPSYPYRLYYTYPAKSYAWDSTYYVDRDGKGKIMKLMDMFDALIIFFERGIEMADVSDSTPANWTFVTIPTNIGLASTQACIKTNKGVYFLGIKNGVPELQFLHRGEETVVNATFDNIVPDSLSEKIDTFMSNVNLDAIETCRMHFFDNKIYLSVPYGDSVTPNRTAVYDTRRDAWSIYQDGYYSFAITSDRFLAGSPSDDYCHQLEYGYTKSDGGDITMTWKSPQLNADRPDMTKHWQMIRVRASGASGNLLISWSCDYDNTTGSFNYDLSTDGNEYVRYFPDEAIGRNIQITLSCTNNVEVKVIDIELLFHVYSLGD